MNCRKCKSGAVGMVHQEGGIEKGPFFEVYQCENCGATGRLEGNAEDAPAEWDKVGELYNEL